MAWNRQIELGKWHGGGRFWMARFGPLYLAIEEHDYDGGFFHWYLMPDDEDKCDERAYRSSESSGRILSLEEARIGALTAAKQFIDKLGEDLALLKDAAIPIVQE
jgi:hypothetical protein